MNECLVGVKMPLEMKEKLGYLSRVHGRSLSAEVRKAIQKHLDANKYHLKPKPEGT